VLRKRVIAVLMLNDGVLFRTKLFRPDYRYTTNFVDTWSIDEIVVLDITRTDAGERRNFEAAVSEFARRCFVPLTAGGGVRSLDDVHRLLAIGADKVLVNTGALERPQLITEIAHRYGSQCVVTGIDAKPEGDGYRVYSTFATVDTGRGAADWAHEAQERGAGEILVTAIERDGWLQGYDLVLMKSVTEAVGIPVLALGGCGNWQHMAEVLAMPGVAAACTQNIFHFTENAIRSAKAFLVGAGLQVRTT
jgi:imidazole glycerol-phosphate synthase subunit HisF